MLLRARAGKKSLFEKSSAKIFANLGHRALKHPGCEVTKVFAPLFSKSGRFH
jgi:hypothetical protein